MAWARKKGVWVKSLDFNMERFAIAFPNEGVTDLDCPQAAFGKPLEF